MQVLPGQQWVTRMRPWPWARLRLRLPRPQRSTLAPASKRPLALTFITVQACSSQPTEEKPGRKPARWRAPLVPSLVLIATLVHLVSLPWVERASAMWLCILPTRKWFWLPRSNLGTERPKECIALPTEAALGTSYLRRQGIWERSWVLPRPAWLSRLSDFRIPARR